MKDENTQNQEEEEEAAEDLITALETYVSQNGNYKSIIYPQNYKDKKAHAVSVYIWDNENTDDEGVPTWRRINNPIVTEELSDAQKLAQENLNLMAGEIPDEEIKIEVKTEIKKFLGHDKFYFYKKEQFKVYSLVNPEDEKFEKIKITKIFSTGEFYYAEDLESNWHTGILSDDGEIKSWQKFSSIKIALKETL